MNDNYYILFTCSEYNDNKIHLLLKTLSEQIEHIILLLVMKIKNYKNNCM